VRETEILVEQQPPQGVLVCGRAGLVINKFSQDAWFARAAGQLTCMKRVCAHTYIKRLCSHATRLSQVTEASPVIRPDDIPLDTFPGKQEYRPAL